MAKEAKKANPDRVRAREERRKKKEGPKPGLFARILAKITGKGGEAAGKDKDKDEARKAKRQKAKREEQWRTTKEAKDVAPPGPIEEPVPAAATPAATPSGGERSH